MERKILNVLGKILSIKTKLGKWFWVILAIILIIGFRVISSRNKSIKVQVADIKRGDLVQSVSTSGKIKATEYAILSFQSIGKVAWVGVSVGDKVKKGQVIASLDTVGLNAYYQQALNNYRNYQAAAENTLDQVKNHSGDESFSQKATRTAAEVARDNAYDAVLAAQDNLRNAVLYAPFSGVVTDANPASAGVNTGLGTSNYTVVNPETVYFEAEVDETDLPHIKVGQTVDIKLDAYPEDAIQGKVEVIGFVASTSSTGGNAYKVKINLPENIDMKFKVGMQGDVEIIYNTVANVLMVPSSDVITDSSNSYVLVIENGKAKKVEVKIGSQAADYEEIVSGLEENQKIIDNPPIGLKSGQKVSE